MFTITINLPDSEVNDKEYKAKYIEEAFYAAKRDYPNWTSMVIVVSREQSKLSLVKDNPPFGR